MPGSVFHPLRLLREPINYPMQKKASTFDDICHISQNHTARALLGSFVGQDGGNCELNVLNLTRHL